MVTPKHGEVSIDNLKLGDMVLTADNKYEKVYSFGHYNSTTKATFLRLSFTGGAFIEVSADHMIFVEGRKAVPASFLVENPNLRVEMTDGELVTIESVETVHRDGIYSPFTSSGSIVVNGVLASTFVAFQSSPVLSLGSTATPLSFQWLALAFESPHRLYCSVVGCLSESYTEEGVSLWVNEALRFSVWLMEQDSWLVGVMLLFWLPFLFVFWAVEKHGTTCLVVLGVAWYQWRLIAGRKVHP